MELQDLRTYGYICGQIGAKILRLRASPSAQDDITFGASENFKSHFVAVSKFPVIAPNTATPIPEFWEWGCWC